MKVRATVTATGNAGVHIATSAGGVFIDAFWDAAPRFLGGRTPPPVPDLPAELMLVTHNHWDHFSIDRVAEAVGRSRAKVGAAADVIDKLSDVLPGESLIELEPPETASGHPATSVTVRVGEIEVTAFRTHHGRRHNSYLVRSGGASFFHDGDNENTRPLAIDVLRPVDVLMLCPWQGSDWAELVERVEPRHWLLIHLDEGEIAAHRAGRFLSELAPTVPLADRAVALGPGQSLDVV